MAQNLAAMAATKNSGLIGEPTLIYPVLNSAFGTAYDHSNVYNGLDVSGRPARRTVQLAAENANIISRMGLGLNLNGGFNRVTLACRSLASASKASCIQYENGYPQKGKS